MPQVTVKEAANKAVEFLQGIQPGNSLNNLAVEEVFQSDDGQFWIITLGHDPVGVSPTMAFIAGSRRPRDYKQIEVNVQSGEVTKMEIRQLAGVS